MKELGDDLREVRRQIDSTRPAAALKATSAPAAPRSTPAPERTVDTATMPMGAAATEKKEEDTKPVPLAKTFDSFDATLRLAAMTDQTEDFRDYITATQKMRAYRGKIEASSPLAAQAEAQPAAEPEERRPTPAPPKRQAPVQVPERVPAGANSSATNLIAIGAIVVLAVAAVALVIALVIR